MELYGSNPGQQKTGLNESMRMLNLSESEVYPENPGRPDCAYYMRTGSCGYGAACRYNHPRNRISKLGGGEYPERVGEPECQYYLRTGACKFGTSCKFNHPKNASGSRTNVPLSSYGYPLRPGEKECSYYLQSGQCKFGVTCKFDHPQITGSLLPVSARPFYPTVQNLPTVSPEQFDGSGNSYGVARPPLVPGSYVAGAYGPMMFQQGAIPISNWNPYSGPVSRAPSPGPGASSIYVTSQSPSYNVLSSNTNKEHGQFPERPGQPDCKYYIRTGDCKYGSSCRYNHPPDRVGSNLNCDLSLLGLPIREGVEACSFYMQNGNCKFGRTCKFNHPMENVGYNPSSTYIEISG